MDWHYIAGFFDGEGSISYNFKNKRSYVYVRILNKNKDVLNSIKSFLRFGHILTYNKGKTTEAFVFQISCQKDVKQFLSEIISLLIVKKEKSLKALNYIMKHPLIYEAR